MGYCTCSVDNSQRKNYTIAPNSKRRFFVGLSILSIVNDPEIRFHTGIYSWRDCQIISLRLEGYGLLGTVALLTTGPRLEIAYQALADICKGEAGTFSDFLSTVDREALIKKIEEIGDLLKLDEKDRAQLIFDATLQSYSNLGVSGGLTAMSPLYGNKDQMDSDSD